MPVETATLTAITALWRDHAVRYAPGVYGVVLCGGETGADRALFAFLHRYRGMVGDMAGPYTSLALIARPLAEEVRDAAGRDAGYLHTVTSWQVHADGVYSVAHALRVPLETMPAVVLSAAPSAESDLLILPLRPAEATADGHVAVLRPLLSACRAAYDEPVAGRLKLIARSLRRPGAGRGAALLDGVQRSGVLAQIVEGVLKGLS